MKNILGTIFTLTLLISLSGTAYAHLYEDMLVNNFTSAEGYTDNMLLKSQPAGLGWTQNDPSNNLYTKTDANYVEGYGLSFDNNASYETWALKTLPITLGDAGSYFTFHIKIGSVSEESNDFQVSLQDSAGNTIARLNLPEYGVENPSLRKVCYWTPGDTYTPTNLTITEGLWAEITLLFGGSTYSIIVDDSTASFTPSYTVTIAKEKFHIRPGGNNILNSYVYIDAIYVNPEPATILMTILSLGGLGLRFWKRKR